MLAMVREQAGLSVTGQRPLAKHGLTSPKPDRTFRWALAASLAAALAVVSPFCFFGQASGHDFQFHIASWMDAAQQWRAGVVLPRWAAWANYGYGEPRFLFYPPLSWCLGAVLGSVLPWSFVPATFIVLCLVLAGASMYRMARSWLSPEGAFAASLLYAVNPYSVVLAYVRSDFAELLAAALFPLAIHYALRCAGPEAGGSAANSEELSQDAVPLALAYCAIWLTNAPAAVVASYSLAFLLAVCAILRRSFRPLLRGFAALALGLMLAGFYVVPAAYERGWVNINQALSAGFQPAENFLFTWILDPEHNLVNLEISAVAVLIITLTGIGAVVSHRRALSSRFAWMAMFALAVLCAVLMFPVSAPLWQYAPELRFLQFPWRWLLPLGISFAFFLGESIATSQRRLAAALACGVVLAGTGAAIARSTYWDSDDLDDVVTAMASEKGYEGTYEYCTTGADQTQLPQQAPPVALLPAEADATRSGPTGDRQRGTVSVQDWQPERKAFVVEAARPARAAVRLLSYPAWKVTVNGAPATPGSDPETGQMIVPVPAGKSTIEIRFARTADRTAGGILSCVAGLALSGIAALGRRRGRAAGS